VVDHIWSAGHQLDTSSGKSSAKRKRLIIQPLTVTH